MTVDEAKIASELYSYYANVLSAAGVAKNYDKDNPVVKIGIGRSSMGYGYPEADVLIDRDLVGRMLEHALARAKAKVDDFAAGEAK